MTNVKPETESTLVASTELAEEEHLQIGERRERHVGGNVSYIRHVGHCLATKLEEMEKTERVTASLKEQLLGKKRSPLGVTFSEIADDINVLDTMQPLDHETGMNGVQLLWEGHQGTKRDENPRWHLSTPYFRVLRGPLNNLIFQKRTGSGWAVIPRFERPPFFRKKQEDEMGSNTRAVVSQDRQRNTVITRNRNFST